jgi:hypothetical protein
VTEAVTGQRFVLVCAITSRGAARKGAKIVIAFVVQARESPGSNLHLAANML